jgi:hypothetical protein
VTADVVDGRPTLLYQQLADRANCLRELGLSFRATGRALQVDYKVAIKAVEWAPSR